MLRFDSTTCSTLSDEFQTGTKFSNTKETVEFKSFMLHRVCVINLHSNKHFVLITKIKIYFIFENSDTSEQLKIDWILEYHGPILKKM